MNENGTGSSKQFVFWNRILATCVRERSRSSDPENKMNSRSRWSRGVDRTLRCHGLSMTSDKNSQNCKDWPLTTSLPPIWLWMRLRAENKCSLNSAEPVKEERAVDLSCLACGAGAWALGLDSRWGFSAPLCFRAQPPISSWSYGSYMEHLPCHIIAAAKRCARYIEKYMKCIDMLPTKSTRAWNVILCSTVTNLRNQSKKQTLKTWWKTLAFLDNIDDNHGWYSPAHILTLHCGRDCDATIWLLKARNSRIWLFIELKQYFEKS